MNKKQLEKNFRRKSWFNCICGK